MKKILSLVFLLIVALGYSQSSQEIYQRAKISYSQKEDAVRLSHMGVPMDHGIHKKGSYLISEFSTSELEIARQNGYQVEVLIEDASAHFLEQNRNPQPIQERNPSCAGGSATFYETPDNFNLGSMGGYLTYQELLDELDEMRSLYPNLISAPSNIGNFLTEGQPDNSVTPSIGGNPIKWIKISDNPDSTSEGEPQILHTSIHHAREPVSLMQLVFYMWYLLENYDVNPDVQNIVNNTEIYFVPVVNPDGYLYNQVTDPNGGGFWRKNRKNGNGVDNNRNYNFFIDGNPNNGVWSGPGSSPDPNSGVYHGPSPFSEIENQAIKYFVEQHEFVMAFNNHTSGELLYFPHAYADVATPDEELFIGITDELVSQNGFNNLRDSPFSGDSDDYMYGGVGTHDKILAFTPEIGPSFWPPSNQIENLSRTMMYLNLTAAKMVNNYAAIEETSSVYIGNTSTAEATFDIRRLGVSGSGNFTVSLNPVSSNITSAGTPVNYSNLDILDTETGAISYTLAAGTEFGENVVFELVVNNESYDSSTIVTKVFGDLSIVFEDPGDSVTDNFDNNGWGTTSQTFVSPSSSITDSPSGNYDFNTNKTIAIGEPIDLSEATGANISYYAKWNIENNWDYVQIEVSIDNGGNWIPQCGNYTNPGSNNPGQPNGEPLYDGDQNNWIFEEINLSDYLGENVLVRFHLVSDDIENDDGFYFDDLKINVIGEGTLGVSEVEGSQFAVYPNPVKDLLNIVTPLNDYSVEIYNINGVLVHQSKQNSGSKTVDYSGFSSGIYIMKLSSDRSSQTIKIVKQ